MLRLSLSREEAVPVDVEIESLGPMTLAGLKVVGTRDELRQRVPEAWQELVDRLGELPARPAEDVFWGAFPESAHAGGGDYTYLVAIEVPAGAPLPPGLVSFAIPARRYARGSVIGDEAAVEAVYRGLFAAVSASEHRADPEAWSLERYDRRRQSIVPPYDRLDYDVLKPLA